MDLNEAQQWLTPDERLRLHALTANRYFLFQKRCLYHPGRFVTEAIDWGAREGAKPYQLEIVQLVPEKQRVSVRAPHSAGKTTLAALTILWFALTRDGWSDWKIPTTASAWRQLEKYLWPEVHKWAKRLKWDVIGRKPFAKGELLDLALKLSSGEAFAVASDQPALIEGAHASRILYVFDESKAIPAATFDAAEGALAQAGIDGKEAFALSISTPGPPTGRFYEIQRRARGFEDWHVRHIKKQELIDAGQMGIEWAEKRREQWGEDSAVYKNRVEGEFASDDEKAIIPLSWVEAAQDRWRVWKERRERDGKPLRARFVGADIARSGKDKNTVAIVIEEPDLTVVAEIRRAAHRQDTMVTTGQIKAIIDSTGARPVVDVIGLGAGVVDRLRELGVKVIAFNASVKTDHKDISGERGFNNLRSAGWWTLRERLDPGTRLKPIALPDDHLLVGDLTTPRSRDLSGGAIAVESKDEIAKRLDGRSTDTGDAVMMAIAGKLAEKSDREWEVF